MIADGNLVEGNPVLAQDLTRTRRDAPVADGLPRCPACSKLVNLASIGGYCRGKCLEKQPVFVATVRALTPIWKAQDLLPVNITDALAILHPAKLEDVTIEAAVEATWNYLRSNPRRCIRFEPEAAPCK
jgi:hypothetical protein